MMADLNKVRAETKKLQAETAKINKEATRYDWTVASSFSAFVTALLRLVF